jgi:hypothetical protein
MKNTKIISVIAVSVLLLGASLFLAGCGNNNSQDSVAEGFLPSNSGESQNSSSGDIIIDKDSADTATSPVSSTPSGAELDLDKEIREMDSVINSDTASDLNDSTLSDSQLGI